MLPLPAAMATDPSPSTYPSLSTTALAPTPHTGDAMRHGQSAHSWYIDASVPMSVGIVPDREL